MKLLAWALLMLTAAYQLSSLDITHVITLEPVYTLPFSLESSVEIRHSAGSSSDVFIRFSTGSTAAGPFPWGLTDTGVSYTARPIQSFDQDLLLRCALSFGAQGRITMSASAELALKTPPYARILSAQVRTSPPGRTHADMSATMLLVVSRELGFSCTASLSLSSKRAFASGTPPEVTTGFSLDVQGSLVGKHTTRHAGVRLDFLPGLVIPSVICSWTWSADAHL